jgi:nicotinate-nucleotide adenylyltransferase
MAAAQDPVRRLGVFGGTFDPVHNAHLAMARAARDFAQLDEVLFVVSARPPHKREEQKTPAEVRLAMVEAALAAESGMRPCRLELDRDGPSYTADTLEALARQQPDAALYLIVGMDSLVDLPEWRRPDAILRHAHLLAIPRPGNWEVPPALAGHYDIVPFGETTVSSTEVRERIAATGDADEAALDDLVPRTVLRIIRRKGLYESGPSNPLC